MRNAKRWTIILLISLLSVLPVVGASAAPTNYVLTVEGSLSPIDFHLAPYFSLGDRFTLTFLLDSNVPDTSSDTPNSANYDGAVIWSTAKIGGNVWSTNSQTNGGVYVRNDIPLWSQDEISYSSVGPMTGPNVGNRFAIFMGALFVDPTKSIILDENIILDPSVLMTMPVRTMEITFATGLTQSAASGVARLFGNIDSVSITPVVEPSPILLIVLFPIGLALKTRAAKVHPQSAILAS